MKKENHEIKKRPLALGLTLMGAVLRLIPHLPNFAPVGGLSLFAGARLRGWQAYSVPLVIMAVTDPILGRILGYPAYTLVTPFVYGSFLISVWIGSHLRRSERPWWIGGAALLGSSQFFLISNFGVWAAGISYPLTLSGLMACYVAAIPYFGRTVLSDLLYSGILFGLHAWLARVAFPKERVTGEAEVVLP
ncbi:hypothetical protein MYX82_13320 [Acidobacteria bacterium AH-259-D05]|nr:hypothetical protein [Acidobacteria bacterium AH-259-D05]